MNRRRALMAGQWGPEESNMIDFSSININGTLKAKEVTVGSNSITNASQIWTYFKTLLEDNERPLMVAATQFTNTQNGVKYGFVKGGLMFFSTASPGSNSTFGRYKDGSVSEINTDSASYETKLTNGDKYLVLYETNYFTKTTT